MCERRNVNILLYVHWGGGCRGCPCWSHVADRGLVSYTCIISNWWRHLPTGIQTHVSRAPEPKHWTYPSSINKQTSNNKQIHDQLGMQMIYHIENDVLVCFWVFKKSYFTITVVFFIIVLQCKNKSVSKKQKKGAKSTSTAEKKLPVHCLLKKCQGVREVWPHLDHA